MNVKSVKNDSVHVEIDKETHMKIKAQAALAGQTLTVYLNDLLRRALSGAKS